MEGMWEHPSRTADPFGKEDMRNACASTPFQAPPGVSGGAGVSGAQIHPRTSFYFLCGVKVLFHYPPLFFFTLLRSNNACRNHLGHYNGAHEYFTDHGHDGKPSNGTGTTTATFATIRTSTRDTFRFPSYAPSLAGLLANLGNRFVI